MKQIVWFVTTVVAVLVGLGLLLPALAKLRAFGHLSGPEVGYLLFGILLILAGPVTAVLVRIRRRT